MAGDKGKNVDAKTEVVVGGSNLQIQNTRRTDLGVNTTLKTDEWAMEVYKGSETIADDAQADHEVLEFELDEEEAEQASKYLAIAVFYSRKSCNPQALFSDMMTAWGIQGLTNVEKIGDYTFRLEFRKEEEKKRVIEGGPWRHKGDDLIVVHYDGLSRPSEVHIDSIGLWVRFYDLPLVMMKEAFAKQLGSQLGKYVKMDIRYLGYMRVRVEFPLAKPLMASITVRIKGRGAMEIKLRYKNVPHFCFTCGRLGHTAINCDDEENEEGGCLFGEELRASPPKRVREISVKAVQARVVKPLF
jgi:hypothetical protein